MRCLIFPHHKSTVSLVVSVLIPLSACISAEKQSDSRKQNNRAMQHVEMHAMQLNPLTPEEARVIQQKGTEPPSAIQDAGDVQRGTYLCRQCNAPLYRSADKFVSHCGWPSFDDETPGAVKRVPDADGRRTEIVCATCGGHLGHVFLGEGFTQKNTRHCVNAIYMRFVPEVVAPGRHVERALFASGCFWGTQYALQHEKGVLDTKVGYCGGHTPNPTYRQVCAGNTGHAETVEVLFDPETISYEKLVKLFFETHDPTQVNRQGPDRGHQYRSAIFFLGPEQKRVAEKVRDILETQGLRVATRIVPAGAFYPAEAYHQDYYERKGIKSTCHRRVVRFPEP